MENYVKIDGITITKSNIAEELKKIVKNHIGGWIEVELPSGSQWTYEVTYRWIQKQNCREFDNDETVLHHTAKLERSIMKDLDDIANGRLTESELRDDRRAEEWVNNEDPER